MVGVSWDGAHHSNGLFFCGLLEEPGQVHYYKHRSGAHRFYKELYCASIFSFVSSALSARRLRAMIWRFISLVPSPISLILTCRQ